jgi:hypothetical protein
VVIVNLGQQDGKVSFAAFLMCALSCCDGFDNSDQHATPAIISSWRHRALMTPVFN